jgi:hypothetical protein
MEGFNMPELYKGVGIPNIMTVEDKLILDLADMLEDGTLAKEVALDLVKIHTFNK